MDDLAKYGFRAWLKGVNRTALHPQDLNDLVDLMRYLNIRGARYTPDGAVNEATIRGDCSAMTKKDIREYVAKMLTDGSVAKNDSADTTWPEHKIAELIELERQEAESS